MTTPEKPPYVPPTIESLEDIAAKYAEPRAEMMSLEIQRAFVSGFVRGYETGLARGPVERVAANEEHA